MSRTTCLQGEPGSGKSSMLALTSIRKPVLVLDVDRKIQSAGWAQPALKSGELICWELKEAFDDSNLKSRMMALAKMQGKPTIAPKGWETLANMIYDLAKTEEGKRAGTWGWDSLTISNEHMKSMIMYYADRTKFAFDQWNALKIGWMDTLSFIRDLARENDKDLTMTVHERFKEEPGDKTLGAKMEVITSKDGEKSLQRSYVGQQDIKVWASIDGAFGDLIGAQCDEYYHLYIDATDKDKPKWLCRVWPDGRRALRTSFMLPKAVYNPDFREIWK